ncbi:MAG: hydroxymethylbilane synthase [Lachnospiraceae bacterium]|nr:hydroxymethylbilane synthase [Lachnospiraceae bacterium]
MKTVKIGTRDSALALAQTNKVADFINSLPDMTTELITMKTIGDKILDRPLKEVGGKGLFVKELDKVLLSGLSDLSVHSLKDLPSELPEELPVLGYLPAADCRDVLVLPAGLSADIPARLDTQEAKEAFLKVLDPSKPVGTSSPRRVAQLEKLFPTLTFETVRGNLATRLKKLDEGQYSAIILASAGLTRLGLVDRISYYFDERDLLPAAGQGVIAVQGREGVDYAYLMPLFDAAVGRRVLCERAFVRRLNGDCSTPAAAHAIETEGKIRLEGYYVNEANGRSARDIIMIEALDEATMTEKAYELADRLMAETAD